MAVVELQQGSIEITDTGGEGPTLLFIHGLLVNGRIWDSTVEELRSDYRCVVPDLPLGAHARPMNDDAELSPPAVAALIADLMDEMDLTDVTLIGSDTGGALCQLVIAHHPVERVARLVLTNCDAYENFLPKAFRPLEWFGRVPGLAWVAAQGFRAPFAQIAFVKTVARTPLDPEMRRSFARSFIKNAAVRRDAVKVLGAIDERHTLEAAERFRTFHRPVLLAWGVDDRFFKPKYAERLAKDFPNATIEWFEGSRAFVQIDKPRELARAIDRFFRS